MLARALFLLAAGGLAGGMTLGACGYHAATPGLPGGEQALEIAPVANETATGELDLRLRVRLRRRLLAHPAIRPPASEGEGLSLRVRLTRHELERQQSRGGLLTRVHTLRGTMSLTRRRDDVYLRRNLPVQVRIERVDTSPGGVETPAALDPGTDDVLDAFAAEVERQVFLNF